MLYTFEDCELDLRRYELRRAGKVICTGGKVVELLAYLVTHRGSRISKEQLLEHVWKGVFVADSTLSNYISDLRQAIGDRRRPYRMLKTMRGQGYCFDASVQAGATAARSSTAVLPALLPFAGRENELAQLHEWFTTARQGRRQICFVTGTAGIGKSALMERFVAHAAAETRVWIGQGQCINQYGEGEAYLPLLDVLEQFCRGAEGDMWLNLLREHAPSWLMQIPTLLSPPEREDLQRRESAATRDRMLRELTTALEVVTAERLLVLVLEDLHWSDVSTLAWLDFVARRRDPAHLFIVGTYRSGHIRQPLRTMTQELRLHGHCMERVLHHLSGAGVTDYLVQRLATTDLPVGLAQAVYQRTQGHPLFLSTLIEELVRQDVIAKGEQSWHVRGELRAAMQELPANVRQMIEQQLEQLPPTGQALLGVASVVGTTFSLAAVMAGADQDEETIEELFASLARQGHFVQTCGIEEWPDGTISVCYTFRHALHHEVLYEHLSPGRRRRLHRQIGARKEAGYGEQARLIASELAMHFVHAGDTQRAVHYLGQAGQNALSRSAHQEAIRHATQGLKLLRTLAETPADCTCELNFQITLATALTVTQGFAMSEVENAYSRAREICQQVGVTSQLFPILWGIWLFYIARAEFAVAEELARQYSDLASTLDEPCVLAEAHYMLGVTAFYRGELTEAGAQLTQGESRDASLQAGILVVHHGYNPRILGRSRMALVLWWRGYPEQALHHSQEVLAIAQTLPDPFNHALALATTALIHLQRREGAAAQAHAQTMIMLAKEHGFPHWLAQGAILLGCALVEQGEVDEGILYLRQGLSDFLAIGIRIGQVAYSVKLAEAYWRGGQLEAGLQQLTEAEEVMHTYHERFYQGELYRFRGEILLSLSPRHNEEAVACLTQALHLTHHQQAKSLELRAAMSLSQYWQQRGERYLARQCLAGVYPWFTEGLNTADLREAKALQEALAQ